MNQIFIYRLYEFNLKKLTLNSFMFSKYNSIKAELVFNFLCVSFYLHASIKGKGSSMLEDTIARRVIFARE